MIKSMMFIVVSSFLILLTGCGLYSLGAFGSCDKWEIYSEKSITTTHFKLRVCGSALGYPFQYLGRKKINEIQNIVYPKLNKLVEEQDMLSECIIRKESISFQYGIPRDPIESDVICKKNISFKRKVGRFFMTSFPFK